MSKECIIIGGGKSVREGLESDLWEKIKGKDIWSLNYTYKLMPYLPTRQCFVDFNFFKNNENDLHDLASKGVPIHCKANSRLRHIENPIMQQYNTVREEGGFRGKEALNAPPEVHIYVGGMGLVGTFSLSLAIAEGYDKIYLLGYDFGPTSIEDKDTHWYQKDIKVKSTGVSKPTVYWNNTGLKKQLKNFQIFNTVDEIQYYNVTSSSNIPYFEKINYDKFYELIGEINV